MVMFILPNKYEIDLFCETMDRLPVLYRVACDQLGSSTGNKDIGWYIHQQLIRLYYDDILRDLVAIKGESIDEHYRLLTGYIIDKHRIRVQYTRYESYNLRQLYIEYYYYREYADSGKYWCHITFPRPC